VIPLQVGDVINTAPPAHGSWWKLVHPLQSIPAWAIRRYQRTMGYRNWQDTHTMLYLGDERILSVTWPKAKWEKLDKVAERCWFLYRPTFALDSHDRENLHAAAEELIGWHYDIGQLLDIALNKILKYGVGRWVTFFDSGARQKVCSVGVRACFEHARKVKEAAQLHPPFDILFTINEQKLHVEKTCPADFANSPKFNLIGAWKEGEREG